uniref:Uncharacterized protein LOC109689459 isoform X3 n=1 Tax=Castor canadensis TaxID=51338 RepID=A0A8B7UW68_CASCN|nr:uncharacterized protein LOC109689459 isoform X3 [Castor canadensis]
MREAERGPWQEAGGGLRGALARRGLRLCRRHWRWRGSGKLVPSGGIYCYLLCGSCMLYSRRPGPRPGVRVCARVCASVCARVSVCARGARAGGSGRARGKARKHLSLHRETICSGTRKFGRQRAESEWARGSGSGAGDHGAAGAYSAGVKAALPLPPRTRGSQSWRWERCDETPGARNVPILKPVGAWKYRTFSFSSFPVSFLNPKIWRSKFSVECKVFR